MNTGMMEGCEECCIYEMQTCLINKPNQTLILFVSPDNSGKTTDHGFSPLSRIPNGRWHCCDFDLYNVIEFQFGPYSNEVGSCTGYLPVAFPRSGTLEANVMLKGYDIKIYSI